MPSLNVQNLSRLKGITKDTAREFIIYIGVMVSCLTVGDLNFIDKLLTIKTNFLNNTQLQFFLNIFKITKIAPYNNY